jgi:hypothetical protein
VRPQKFYPLWCGSDFHFELDERTPISP